MNILEQNIGERLKDTSISRDFLNRTPMNQGLRTRILKLLLYHIKKILQSKSNNRRVKRQPTE
jgi:hypothetical protein